MTQPYSLSKIAYVLMYLQELNDTTLGIPSTEEILNSSHYDRSRIILRELQDFFDYPGKLWDFVIKVRPLFEQEFEKRSAYVLGKLSKEMKKGDLSGFGTPFSYDLEEIPLELQKFRVTPDMLPAPVVNQFTWDGITPVYLYDYLYADKSESKAGQRELNY